jgi:hypothetical protein
VAIYKLSSRLLSTNLTEIWSLILREEHKLSAFENRVLRRIFGPKRDEVTGGWKKLHNEELDDFYYSTSIDGIINSRGMCHEWGEGERV